MSKNILEQLRMVSEHYNESMKRDGFAVHSVPLETTHTHGLVESFSHPEIECVLRTDAGLLMELIKGLGLRVKAGERFPAGDMVEKVLLDLPVKLVACANGLRLIIPDSTGELEQVRMEPIYARQYMGLEFRREELFQSPPSDPKFRN